MHRGLFEAVRSWRPAWALLALATALALMIAHWPASKVDAQESKPPLGDCWGGVLADEPLHCYILEQAQIAGKIEVDAIFDRAGVLLFYLKQPESLTNSLGAFLKAKATKFIELWPHLVVPQTEEELVNDPLFLSCVKDYGVFEYGACLIDIFSQWEDFLVFPPLKSYVDIRLVTGGADARMRRTGWRSYRRMWPLAPGTVAGAPVTPAKFDLSDVDMTTVEPVRCRSVNNATWDETCSQWHRHPGLGIAGWRSDQKNEYVQVKAPLGQLGQEEKIASAKKEIIEYYPRINEGHLVMIPVKYDYEEFWQWAAILDRFAASSANTLGIRGGAGIVE